MNNATWFDNIRIYHLLIDRFNGGWQTPPKSENIFCGGNLQGVINKLDYIKELGFNAVMLSPIFKTANYHGYHTLNFDEVDPQHLGGLSAAARPGTRQGNADYLRLCAQPLLVSGTDL